MCHLATIESNIMLLNDTLRKIGVDGYIIPDEVNCTTELLQVLSKMFKDEQTDWIGYFYTDMDFGANYKPGMITGENGEEIPLRNADDLWSILVEPMKEYK